MRQAIPTCIAVAFLVAGASAAPAPAPRSPGKIQVRFVRPAHFYGCWVMTWGGSTYDTTFYHGGSYTCVGGGKWVGSWCLDRNGNLYVWDVQAPSTIYSTPAGPKLWSVKWYAPGGELDMTAPRGKAIYDNSNPIDFGLRRPGKVP